MGLGKVTHRIEQLILMLKSEGYEFMFYEEMRKKLTEEMVACDK